MNTISVYFWAARLEKIKNQQYQKGKKQENEFTWEIVGFPTTIDMNDV
jgi:hypothetical protein